MSTGYNRIAGGSVERLAALSDGIFAVAMTLLVLDLHGPAREAIHSGFDLWRALEAMAPQLVTYLLSFLMLSIFWNGQQAQLNHFSRGDRHLTWINLGFLFFVSIMPLTTRLLADFIRFKVALVCYWGNVVMLGAMLFISWRYARSAGLLKDEAIYEVQCAIERRILVGQALYAVGASLCLWDTYYAIGFIVLVQLNFALAPRIGWLSKI
jgi:uncharacterized membrane protein